MLQAVTRNAKVITNSKDVENAILASLPRKEFTRLQTALDPVTLKFGQVLYEPGKTIRHVYFPIDCLISLAHCRRQTPNA